MDEQQMQQQIMQLVQAAMSGDQQAKQQIKQIMQDAQQGDKQAEQIAQMIQAVAQQMQEGGQAPGAAVQARNGAKLEYIKYLRGQCPPGYEMRYFKAGGRICKKCLKKAANGGQTNDLIQDFKSKRKTK